MEQPQCYKVTLKSANLLGTSAVCDGRHITVEDGVVYVLAKNALEAAALCPEAVSIERIGIGYKPASACNDVVCIQDEPEDADIIGWDGPGWYFRDEVHQVHGPFATKEEASAASNTYHAQMSGGAK